MMHNFKAAYKHEDKRRRGAWRHVSIEGEKALWDLDRALRQAFGHDLDDHLSEYTIHGYKFLVSPERGTDSGWLKVEDFFLKKGMKIKWVWDLGNCWEHIVVFTGSV